MAPQDATMFWLSARTRNDLFLVYSFADAGVPTDALRAAVAARSARIPDLRVRLREAPADLAYPSWVPGEFSADQFVEHRLPGPDWAAVETALGDLLATGVDARVHPWRLHVFRGVAGAPMRGSDEELAIVVVLQMSHALADGKRAAVIARELFGAGAGRSSAVDGGTAGRGADVAVAGGAGQADEAAARGGGQADEAAAGKGGQADVAAARRAGQMDEAAARKGGQADGVGHEADRPESELGGCRRVDEPIGRAGSGGRWIGVSTAFGAGAELITRLWDSALLDALRGAVRIPAGMVNTAVRGYGAYRAQTELARLTEVGQVPPPGPGFAPSMVNKGGAEGVIDHRARMIVCTADELRVPGRTITVVVLTAVSVALAEYLAAHGEPADQLGAQVPMALPESDKTLSHNNYRSLGINLFVDEPDLRVRADRIAAALADRRLRAQHPLLSAQDRVTAVTPAPILRRDVDRYPIDTVPDSIAGHTVVSSVDRGPADLSFGGGPVRCTGGFPALGAVMHLTHGVHGLGDTVTVSVHADAAVVPDVDEYANLLRAALREVSAALGEGGDH
ncbi:wax ester/triacylglycerol synthase domain-containing protein [Nocardia sp. bgisy118]|uniref:wax ester/triacylglycerol synthase domain-containing protein n=1 Tax=Nocardia sp. bgisy118 TaxID=3413786 RepID=UPI003F49FADD